MGLVAKRGRGIHPRPLEFKLGNRAKFLSCQALRDLDGGIITIMRAAVLNSYQVGK